MTLKVNIETFTWGGIHETVLGLKWTSINNLCHVHLRKLRYFKRNGACSNQPFLRGYSSVFGGVVIIPYRGGGNSNIFCFHLYFGKIQNPFWLAYIFQMGWEKTTNQIYANPHALASLQVRSSRWLIDLFRLIGDRESKETPPPMPSPHQEIRP